MAYSLSTHYAGQGLLDSFSFFTGSDPSNGFVDYQSRDAAIANNLVAVDESNRVRLGVDSDNIYSTSDQGRPSVRLTSNDDFTHGLFIADFAHMPASSCGTWPAFWAFNNQDVEAWPTGGELDIIEGANTAERNLFSAHTTDGCEAPSDGFTGEQGETDCSPDLNNIGCNYLSPTTDTTSYGDAFNAEGGGVYALEWTSDDLKIWHFPRSAIPEDIALAPLTSPDPSTWGLPQARFGGSSCDPDTYFFNMSLVINTNFCGDYAGQTWSSNSQCSALAPSCEAYVAGNPGSFKGAYWDINYIDVYQLGASTGMTVPSVPPTTTTSTLPSTVTSTVPSIDGSVTPLTTRTITLTTQVTATAQPTQSGGGLTDPSTIGAYTLLGCFGSSSGYQAFAPIASLPNMDSETCVSSCVGRKYAGVSGENCYCADILGDASALSNDMCDTPCPGNGLEFCGGMLDAGEAAQLGFIGANVKLPSPTDSSVRAHRRAAPSDVLLTVYADLAADPAEVPGGAPAMGGHAPAPVPSNVTTAITVTYTTVCATNPALLVETEYRTTVTYEDCGCTRTRSPATATPGNLVMPTSVAAAVAVPMTTCTETCRGCGPHGESTVTLTIPSAVYTPHDVIVTAVAVQTVVPLVANTTLSGSSGNVTLPVSNGTVVPPSVAPPLPPSVPVHGAASGLRSVVGCGLGLWIGVLGLLIL
ncbi:glycoside hydrolase family 16 protein [Biscogniauxia mediterranea]|nr:glycoside hydrolase family 16 protein [Biscogniauxia mediterranea]